MTEPAFLYVIGEEDGPHKVGLSAAPRRRLSELQCGNCRTLYLRRASPTAVKDAGAIEAWAHHLMFAHRLRGEWFDVDVDEAWKQLHAAEMAVLCGRPTPSKMPSSGKIGRPSLRPDDPTVKTTIRLPASLLARVKTEIGEGDVSKLIRDLLERELRSRARKPNPTDP